MAVGVIIGAAFQGIVTSLTNDVLNPLLGIAFSTDFSNVVFALPNNADPLRVGAFISAVLNFIIMAFVLFCIVKAMNRLMTLGQKRRRRKPPPRPRVPPRRNCWRAFWRNCVPRMSASMRVQNKRKFFGLQFIFFPLFTLFSL